MRVTLGELLSRTDDLADRVDTLEQVDVDDIKRRLDALDAAGAETRSRVEVLVSELQRLASLTLPPRGK